MSQPVDRFGNPLAPLLPYARGRILRSTEDDARKLQQAWRLIRARGPERVFVFTGLEHGLPLEPEDLRWADDVFAPALYGDRLRALALDHLGGTPDRHDVAVFNRLTGATLATHLTLVRPGDLVVGISASHSHPSVLRAAARAGARFLDTRGLEEFAAALDREPRVALVVLTRLAVTYDLLPLATLQAVVKLAHDRGAPVYVDDAGGARVGPAAFDQPRLLELGADLGATGLDKYGTAGPRLGLLAGERALVSRIRATAYECGLECRPMLYPAVVRTLERYRPARVRELIETTRAVARALRERLGPGVRETPTTAQLPGETILELALERSGLREPPVVPVEATAALAMLLLADHGVLTVHFVAVPPGTGDLLFKFVPPETLGRFGGAERLAEAVDASLGRLAALLAAPDQLRRLLLGDATA